MTRSVPLLRRQRRTKLAVADVHHGTVLLFRIRFVPLLLAAVL